MVGSSSGGGGDADEAEKTKKMKKKKSRSSLIRGGGGKGRTKTKRDHHHHVTTTTTTTIISVMTWICLIMYNLCCILVNLFIAFELAVTALPHFSWACEPVDYSSEAGPLRVASALWLYYVSKCLEFLDSVFMVLRGKSRQLTFLHVYHHSSMFCLWWIGVKYVAGGSSVFGAMFNSSVHVLMYSYYLVAALGPKYRRFLGWKKYLTLIQMAQFVLAIGMGINALRVKCNFPLWMQYAMILYMISFLALFSNFYFNAYNTERNDTIMINNNDNKHYCAGTKTRRKLSNNKLLAAKKSN